MVSPNSGSRLSVIPSRLPSAPNRIGRAPSEALGPAPVQQSAPWRRWYNTARWKALRLTILIRDNYTCQAKRCGRVSDKGMVIDHVRPHRGDERLFWLPTNLQVLCKSPCHDHHKQALEQESRHHAGVWD